MSDDFADGGGYCVCGNQKTGPVGFPGELFKEVRNFSCIVGVIYIAAPANYIEGLPAVLLLLNGSIVTPVYEELLFRGLIWNRCRDVMRSEKAVWLWNIFFFTLWHLGYMIPNIAAGNWSAVLWKLAAGLGYGIVPGFVRIKAKNCSAAILVHGILKLFMV